MTSETSRPRLSLKTRNIDKLVPQPGIERGLDQAQRRPEARPVVDGFREQSREIENRTGQRAARAAACETGDGRGDAIATFLAPVLDHFEADDETAASLAAFTRKLVEGGRPKRGSMAQALRNVDRD